MVNFASALADRLLQAEAVVEQGAGLSEGVVRPQEHRHQVMAVPRRRADQAAAGGAGPAGLEPGGSRVAGKQLVQRPQVIRLVARGGRDVDCLRAGDRGQGGEVSIEVGGGYRQVGGRRVSV